MVKQTQQKWINKTTKKTMSYNEYLKYKQELKKQQQDPKNG
jgi:hypothetical protein